MKQLNNIQSEARGFTLIELLVAFGVLAVIFSIGLLISPVFYRQQVLTSERDLTAVLLQQARSRALNNIHGINHGVYLAENNYILYEGSSFSERNDEFDETFPKSGRVTFGGSNEVNFNALQGNASSSIITITYQADSLDIVVQGNGRIDW